LHEKRGQPDGEDEGERIIAGARIGARDLRAFRVPAIVGSATMNSREPKPETNSPLIASTSSASVRAFMGP